MCVCVFSNSDSKNLLMTLRIFKFGQQKSVHDPQTWLTPHLLQLKSEYEVLLNKHNCKEQESYLVQDQPLPPSDTLLLPPLSSLYKVHMRNQELPQTGDSRPGDSR